MEEPYVVSLRGQSVRNRIVLAAAPVILVVYAVLARSLVSFVVAGIGLLCFLWVAALVVAGRRAAARGAGRRIVVTRDGLSSPWWSLAWDRVASVSIRQSQLGEAIVVEPLRDADVRRVPSRIFAINERIFRRFSGAQLVIPQKLIEEPLADVLAAMEEKSGRAFGRATLG